MSDKINIVSENLRKIVCLSLYYVVGIFGNEYSTILFTHYNKQLLLVKIKNHSCFKMDNIDDVNDEFGPFDILIQLGDPGDPNVSDSSRIISSE